MILILSGSVDDINLIHAAGSWAAVFGWGAIDFITFDDNGNNQVTTGASGMEASHVPMLLDPEPAPFGTLHGHIARSNQAGQPVSGPESWLYPLDPAS